MPLLTFSSAPFLILQRLVSSIVKPNYHEHHYQPNSAGSSRWAIAASAVQCLRDIALRFTWAEAELKAEVSAASLTERVLLTLKGIASCASLLPGL